MGSVAGWTAKGSRKESANEVDAVALTSNMAAADHFVNSIR